MLYCGEGYCWQTSSFLQAVHSSDIVVRISLNVHLTRLWQVESGKLVLEKAEFDLEAELTALIDVFSVQCDNKGLFISLQLAGEPTIRYFHILC